VDWLSLEELWVQPQSTVEEPVAPLPVPYWERLADILRDSAEAPPEEAAELTVQVDGQVEAGQSARQAVATLAIRYRLDDQAIDVLSEVFALNPNRNARGAIGDLLRAGALPVELHVADQVRRIWATYVEFHANPSGHPYTNLSWAAALALVRGFRSVPAADEIELFLLEAHALWRHRCTRRAVAVPFYYSALALCRATSGFETASPAVVFDLLDPPHADPGLPPCAYPPYTSP
jgi:hypothetical protein